jgi:hypothetical protein
MAIMYTYIVRSAEDGNLGVFGSAKKAIRKGIEDLKMRCAERLANPELEKETQALLAEIEKLDVKELSATLRVEGVLEFNPGGDESTAYLCERFNLE